MTGTVIRLRDDEVALFGYGSLISIESLERTLGHPYAGPFVACALEGWQRVWNITMPNQTFFTETSSGRMYPEHILYLNVRPEPGGLLNGVLFVASKPELEGFDRREWIYVREEVTGQIRGATVTGGKAYVYVGNREHVMSNIESVKHCAIRASYLEILETGLGRLGPAFRTDYDASSDPVPKHLVIRDQRNE